MPPLLFFVLLCSDLRKCHTEILSMQLCSHSYPLLPRHWFAVQFLIRSIRLQHSDCLIAWSHNNCFSHLPEAKCRMIFLLFSRLFSHWQKRALSTSAMQLLQGQLYSQTHRALVRWITEPFCIFCLMHRDKYQPKLYAKMASSSYPDITEWPWLVVKH